MKLKLNKQTVKLKKKSNKKILQKILPVNLGLILKKLTKDEKNIFLL